MSCSHHISGWHSTVFSFQKEGNGQQDWSGRERQRRELTQLQMVLCSKCVPIQVPEQSSGWTRKLLAVNDAPCTSELIYYCVSFSLLAHVLLFSFVWFGSLMFVKKKYLSHLCVCEEESLVAIEPKTCKQKCQELLNCHQNFSQKSCIAWYPVYANFKSHIP